MLAANMTDSRCGDAVRQLTSEEREYAAKYLYETDESRASAVAEIRRWIHENDLMRSRTGNSNCSATKDTVKSHSDFHS